jgi:hypothetical protein
MVTAVLAAAALLGSGQSGCAASTVRYEPVKFPGFSDTPWVLPKPASSGLLGALVKYPGSLRDGRVNSSDGLVLWRVGASIAWNRPGRLVARRLDGPGSFSARPEVSSGADISTLRFPSAGCWRLTLRNVSGFGSNIASVVARVVDVPKKLGCDVTVLENGQAFARPRSSGIRGGWPWFSTAQLTTHGHDGDRNMKVPWWVDKGGGSIELVGTRLDAVGRFRQVFPMALSPHGVYPSIVDIPAAGCWMLRLRTGKLAGALIVRAVDAHG